MRKARGTAKPAEKLFLPPVNMWARASQPDPGPSWAAACPLSFLLSPHTSDKRSTTPLTTVTAAVDVGGWEAVPGAAHDSSPRAFFRVKAIALSRMAVTSIGTLRIIGTKTQLQQT